MAGSSKVPVGAKIISVLYYISAVVLVILGILLLVGAGMVGSLLGSIPRIGVFGTSLFIVLGIIMIALGVLCFFVGRGLWKGKQWARIVAIILAILGIIGAVMGMVQGNVSGNIVSLIIHLIIGGYLLLSKGVKQAFK